MNSSSTGGGKVRIATSGYGDDLDSYDDCKQNEVQNLLNSGHSVVWVVTRPASVNYGWMDENLKHVSRPVECSIYLMNSNTTKH